MDEKQNLWRDEFDYEIIFKIFDIFKLVTPFIIC